MATTNGEGGTGPPTSPGGAMAVEKSTFFERTKKILKHFSKHKRHWGDADALVFVFGAPDDPSSYNKSMALQYHLFGKELHNAILTVVPSGVHILADEEVCKGLGELTRNESGDVKVTLHERDAADGDKAGVETLLDLVKTAVGESGATENGESRKVKMGVLVKETAKGQLAERWAAAVPKDEIQEVDVTSPLAHILAVKDEAAAKNMDIAARITSKIFTEAFIQRIEDIIDEDVTMKHDALAEEVEGVIEDPIKIELKVPKEQVRSCYFPIVESGGVYDIKASARSNSNDVKHDIIICSMGASYKGYCANLARTILVDPPKKVQDAYRALTGAYEACLNAMRPGETLKSVYEACRAHLVKEYPAYLQHLPKSLGSSIGVEFRDPQLVINAKANAIFKPRMFFNLAVGFHNIPLTPQERKQGAKKGAPATQLETFSLLIADTVKVLETPNAAPDEKLVTKYEYQLGKAMWWIGDDDENADDEELFGGSHRGAPPFLLLRTLFDELVRTEPGKEPLIRQAFLSFRAMPSPKPAQLIKEKLTAIVGEEKARKAWVEAEQWCRALQQQQASSAQMQHPQPSAQQHQFSRPLEQHHQHHNHQVTPAQHGHGQMAPAQLHQAGAPHFTEKITQEEQLHQTATGHTDRGQHLDEQTEISFTETLWDKGKKYDTVMRALNRPEPRPSPNETELLFILSRRWETAFRKEYEKSCKQLQNGERAQATLESFYPPVSAPGDKSDAAKPEPATAVAAAAAPFDAEKEEEVKAGEDMKPSTAAAAQADVVEIADDGDDEGKAEEKDAKGLDQFVNSDIMCEHDKLVGRGGNRYRFVNADCWVAILDAFPDAKAFTADSKPCTQCQQESKEERDRKKELREQGQQHQASSAHMQRQPPPAQQQQLPRSQQHQVSTLEQRQQQQQPHKEKEEDERKRAADHVTNDLSQLDIDQQVAAIEGDIRVSEAAARRRTEKKRKKKERRRQQKQKRQEDDGSDANADQTQEQFRERQVESASGTIVIGSSSEETPDFPKSAAGDGDKEVVEESEDVWLCEGAPDDLLCPVSMVLLTDPVVAPDGRTYQREELQRCIDYATNKGEEFRSPVTNLPMAPVYFPNVLIRSQVFEYIERKRALRANRVV